MGGTGDVLAETKVTLSWVINLNLVKLEKFDHLHLVYHFKVPLTAASIVVVPIDIANPRDQVVLSSKVIHSNLFGRHWFYRVPNLSY